MTQEKIREHFDYIDGKLYWKKPTSRKIRKGSLAGTLKADSGYVIVSFNRTFYRAHRLIWTMFNGDIPEGKFIDHIDRRRSNNKIENLRLASVSENARNCKLFSTNTSGVKGVSYCKLTDMWRVRIYSKPYQCVELGSYRSFKKAVNIRKEAEAKYGYI